MSKYSFIMPAYKAQYFKEALNSILGQSFRDFNVIISDDCSPEGIKELADSFLSDERVIYRRNLSNMGSARLADHWNLLLDLCDSEYLIVASDDDVYDSRFLEETDSIIQKYPGVNLIHTRARIIDGNGNPDREDETLDEFLPFEKHINHFINPHAVLCIGNYVFRTSALKEAGGFAKLPLGWKSDSATAIELSRAGVACPPDVLFSFRMSGLNISAQVHGDKETDRMKTEAALEFYSRCILPVSLPAGTLDGFKKKLGGEIRSYYTTFSAKEFHTLFSQMKEMKMFASTRNKVSFLLFWIKSQMIRSKNEKEKDSKH